MTFHEAYYNKLDVKRCFSILETSHPHSKVHQQNVLHNHTIKCFLEKCEDENLCFNILGDRLFSNRKSGVVIKKSKMK